jgi:hypothetical protein
MFGLVGMGGGVKVGRAVGRSGSEEVISPNLTDVDGSNRHIPIRMTTRINPIGKRNLRDVFCFL